MKKTDFHFYISGAFQLGIGFGVVSLLSRWVTGNTILSAPETLIKYGLTGGIGYSLMGALSLILFGILAKKIRDRFHDQQTIGDVLRERLTPAAYWLMISVLLIISIHSIFVQAMGAGILLHMIFPPPVFSWMLIFLLFCFFIGGAGGMQRIHQLAGINVVLIFSSVIIIPVYFYIQEGVYPVYEGIKLYHPYILYVKNTDAIWFIFTAVLIGFGQVIIDRASWQRVFIIKKEKLRMTFTLAGLIWATIPLALSSLIMIIIFGRSYDSIYSLLFELVGKINSNLLIILFVLFCISSISSAISAELHAIVILIIKNIFSLLRPLNNKEKWKYSYIFSGAICLFLLLIVSFLPPQPLELLFFLGNIYASMIVPMLYVILGRKRLPVLIPLASLIGTVGGYAALPVAENLLTIWISFCLSSSICLFYFIYHILKMKLSIDSYKG
ncbi:membrane protein [Bacillus sp. J33]|uniref:membrane protein n=1 Tax=Bacillus sp. J33 TaxID=935836 RepID=UPI000478E806|nr:membrane protein [Bacillus sp. J33]